MGEIAGAVAFSALFAGAMWWLFADTEAAPVAEGDGFVLRYGRGVVGMGWMCIGLGIAVLVWVLRSGGDLPTNPLSESLAALFFAGLGLVFLAADRREWTRVTLDGIEGKGLFASEPVSIAWEDVERVRFGRMSGYLRVTSHDGRHVRASALMVGVDDLGSLVARRFPDRGGPEAAKQLRTYRRGDRP